MMMMMITIISVIVVSETAVRRCALPVWSMISVTWSTNSASHQQVSLKDVTILSVG